MATTEDEQAERSRLGNFLDELAEIDPETLIQTDRLGSTFDFRDGMEYFRRTLRLFDDLRSVSLDTVPHKTLSVLADQASRALGQFSAIKEFDPTEHQNTGEARTNLINQIRDGYDGYFTQVAPIVAYATRKGTDFDRIERQARTALAEIQTLQSQVQSELDAAKSQAEGILQAMRTAAAQTGVAQSAIFFEQEADRQATESTKWLKATIALAAVTALAALGALLFWVLGPEVSTPRAIQIAVAKIIFFSVLYYGLVWAGRNFSTHRHNQTVNNHRQNALKTFEAFVKAASDDATKNAVLLQATQSIFSPQASGYLGIHGGESSAPQILEIIRTAATGGGTDNS